MCESQLPGVVTLLLVIRDRGNGGFSFPRLRLCTSLLRLVSALARLSLAIVLGLGAYAAMMAPSAWSC